MVIMARRLGRADFIIIMIILTGTIILMGAGIVIIEADERGLSYPFRQDIQQEKFYFDWVK